MENLKQFMTDDKGNTIDVQDVKLNINEVIGWISDHDQLYEDFQDHFDYVYDTASGNEINKPELDDVLDWIWEHETAWEDFKLYFNIIENEDKQIESEEPEICKYCIGFKNSKGESDQIQIQVKRNNDSIQDEKIELVNIILELSRQRDIQEITYINFLTEDDDDTLEYAFKDNFR